MPTPTYTPLANVTLTGPASTVTFSSISQSYRDLILVVNVFANATPTIKFNGNSGADYRICGMAGKSGGVKAGYQATSTSFQPGYYEAPDSTKPTIITMHILDYSTSYGFKPVLMMDSDGAADADGGVSLWGGSWKVSTNAITSISFQDVNFDANASFALYGVSA